MNELFYGIDILFSGEIFSVLFSEDFPDDCLTKEPHIHKHTKYELHYVQSGSGIFRADSREIVCPQGHVLLIPPGIEHKIDYQEKTKIINFLYSLPSKIPQGSVLSSLRVGEPVLVKDTQKMGESLTKACRLAPKREILSEEYLRGEMTVFFAGLCSALRPRGTEPSRAHRETRAEIIAAYIEKHRGNPDCTCESLAKELHLSTRQLHRLCLEYYGHPFRFLLNRSRMEIARYRLEHSQVSVTELSQSLGYASVASFSAAYKRYFGISPKRKD